MEQVFWPRYTINYYILVSPTSGLMQILDFDWLRY